MSFTKPRRPARHRPVPATPLIAALAVAAMACSPREPSSAPSSDPGAPKLSGAERPPGRPSILLIVVDTLRADLLSLYGHERPTSPRLEELAAEATTFFRAQATAPWTLPSHASLFTGLYPFEHGARSYDPDAIGNDSANILPLGDRFTTLAEALAASGYRTGAFVANRGFLSPAFALDQGFGAYEVIEAPAPEVNARALEWIDEGGAPFFLFLNYMDVHHPYRCEPRPGFPDLGGPGESKELLKELRLRLLDDVVAPAERDLERLRGQYENAVANVDADLGDFFDALRERGLFDELLLAVTSDHGEYFGEHGLIEHGRDLHEEVLRIPLVVKAPGQRDRREDFQWISLVHVPGLLLSQVATGDLPPRSKALTRHWPRGAVFAEKYFGHLVDAKLTLAPRLQRRRKAVYRGDLKLIQSADGVHELYDLGRDPREARNLARQSPAAAAELAELLRPVVPRPPRVRRSAVPRQSRDALRALGYLGDD